MGIKKNKKSLAQFITERREELSFTQFNLAQHVNIPLDVLYNLESGKDLFMSSTIRQKLAKGLKLELKEIKKYEKFEQFEIYTDEKIIDNIKEKILENDTQIILCPKCGSKLATRIAKMYDLEDNLILHPKAHCSKCPFQIK